MKLIGLTEAAAILDWSKQMLNDYIQRGSKPNSLINRGLLPRFPEPVQELSRGRLWDESDVLIFRTEYLIKSKRLDEHGTLERGSAE